MVARKAPEVPWSAQSHRSAGALRSKHRDLTGSEGVKTGPRPLTALHCTIPGAKAPAGSVNALPGRAGLPGGPPLLHVCCCPGTLGETSPGVCPEAA